MEQREEERYTRRVNWRDRGREKEEEDERKMRRKRERGREKEKYIGRESVCVRKTIFLI